MGLLVLIIIVAIVFGVMYQSQNADVNKRCKGKSEQQKQVIKYLYGGCMMRIMTAWLLLFVMDLI